MNLSASLGVNPLTSTLISFVLGEVSALIKSLLPSSSTSSSSPFLMLNFRDHFMGREISCVLLAI
ncbi:hypothetical protein CMO93_01210 [Candidatus Woesearchaeota archaeon]|nr:hypothetical protein [Candidatus Woesearchaeota archaeon]|tara:strand:+ start:6291 stop:6485 length:195 start_codon:yes stop_codon:yes gene_type:complete